MDSQGNMRGTPLPFLYATELLQTMPENTAATWSQNYGALVGLKPYLALSEDKKD